MNITEGYIVDTRTAVAKLFEGIESYRQQFREELAGTTFLTGIAEEEERSRAFEEWAQSNLNPLDRSRAAHRKFYEQRFALAVLCGAVLEVACKGIELCSTNAEVNSVFSKLVVQGKARRFSIGRPVRGVPIGLAIYVGRNQHAHFNEDELNPLNRGIFDVMARHGMQKGSKDPGMDIALHRRESMAANFIHLFGWFDLTAYETDMTALLSEVNRPHVI